MKVVQAGNEMIGLIVQFDDGRMLMRLAPVAEGGGSWYEITKTGFEGLETLEEMEPLTNALQEYVKDLKGE